MNTGDREIAFFFVEGSGMKSVEKFSDSLGHFLVEEVAEESTGHVSFGELPEDSLQERQVSSAVDIVLGPVVGLHRC